MSTGALPVDLAEQLRRARELELLAETEQQYDRAVHATTVLLAAAAIAGWRLVDLAPALGVSAGTVSKRIRDSRRDGRNHPAGLIVEAPVRDRRTPPDESIEWMTSSEAAAYLDVHPRTITGYAARGLLPSTRSGTWRRYCRPDLDRARRGRDASGSLSHLR